MTTPKMTGMTPNSLTGGSFGFSPALLGQSPAALLSKTRSPIPSGNFNSPSMMSAFAMGLGGMDHGLNPSSLGASDEHKKRELWEILRLLETRPGRVSPSSVERLAKRMGLECYKETSPDGTTTLSLAAKIFLLDIDFVGSKAEKTTLSFEKTQGPSGEFAERAAAVFLKDLTADPDPKNLGTVSLLAPSLTRFSDNLQRLANTDRLSSPSLNCFFAITGIYESLQKVYEYEREHLGGELVALCEGNGRPGMHVRGKVGLSIDYWKEQRDTSIGDDDEGQLWRVIVEVDATTPDYTALTGFAPVRASNHWVSDEVKKQRDDNLFGDMDELVTDWLEPPLEELMDASGDSSQSRPPCARFVARLDPPLTVPGFEGPEPTDASSLASSLISGLPIHATRSLHVPDEGVDLGIDEVSHSYTLHPSLQPQKWGYVTEISFSHPKDLVPVFKFLRQHACVTTLLESCFLEQDDAQSTPTPSTLAPMESLDWFLENDPKPSQVLPVDFQISLEEDIGISVVFPVDDGIINLKIQVAKNAGLRVVLMEDSTSRSIAGNSPLDVNLVEKALRVSEDIGLVIEWIRQRYQ